MADTTEEVMRVVAQARARSTRQWTPGNAEDPMAMQKVHVEFNASLIAPEPGWIEIESHTASILNIEEGSRMVWFVTGPKTQRVFLDECLGAFGVAWGPDSATGKYVDLGLRTSDPIDAYLA